MIVIKRVQCLAVLLAALLPLFSGCGADKSVPPESAAQGAESPAENTHPAESADAEESADALGQRSLTYLEQFQRGEVGPFYEVRDR